LPDAALEPDADPVLDWALAAGCGWETPDEVGELADLTVPLAPATAPFTTPLTWGAGAPLAPAVGADRWLEPAAPPAGAGPFEPDGDAAPWGALVVWPPPAWGAGTELAGPPVPGEALPPADGPGVWLPVLGAAGTLVGWGWLYAGAPWPMEPTVRTTGATTGAAGAAGVAVLAGGR
jgi:hypothetical protein